MIHSSQTTDSQKLLRPTFDSLPPSLALSESESLSDSDSDQWQTWNCDIILITSLC